MLDEMTLVIHVDPEELGRWMVRYRGRVQAGLKMRRKDVLDLDARFCKFEEAAREGGKAEIQDTIQSFIRAAAEFRLAQLN